jgi:hypothetical protein
MAIKFRSAQAFMELALGMLALALVLSALFSFTHYIMSSLDMHRSLRGEAGTAAMNSVGEGSYSTAADSEKVVIERFAAEYIFGDDQMKISERVSMPAMRTIKE